MIKHTLATLLILSLTVQEARCEEHGQEGTAIPAPPFATQTIEREHLTEADTLSFTWSGRDPDEIRRFYDQHFGSRGWINPLAEFSSRQTNPQGDWNNYQIELNEQSQAEARYSSTWQADNGASVAKLLVILREGKDQQLTGSATVSILAKPLENTRAKNWKVEIETGLVKTDGNSDSENFNAGISLSKQYTVWAHYIHLNALKSSVKDEDFIDSVSADYMASRTLSNQSYLIGSINYLDDQFDGFTEQKSISAGYGYRLIDSKKNNWEVAAGVGYRDSRELQTLPDGSKREGEDQSSATLVITSNYSVQVTSNTQFIDTFRVEAGTENTFTEYEAALQVSMNERYALKASVLIRHNSDPGLAAKNTDTVTTLNLVYNFGR